MQPPGSTFQKISLPGVRHVVAVASGKGGVGKSTVAANLALALHGRKQRVGLMDADIYGPSIPTLMGLHDADLNTTPPPVERHGIKVMSMGFLVEVNKAAILRGPMVHKYLSLFLERIPWGDLDYLLVDMPPGTGDAQLSLSQLITLAGAIIVTTPQEASQSVARKGLEMFRHLRVPLLGIVENMSYFVGDDGKRYEIFCRGGGQKLADDAGVPFLGEIPIDPRVAQCGDAGDPIVHQHPDSPVAKAYQTLADNVVHRLQQIGTQPALPGLQL